MNKKVFVTQIPTRFDPVTKTMVETINIAPATEHGEPTIMLPAGHNFYATADLSDALYHHLIDYDYERGDSLLAGGDWNIFCIASQMLGFLHGKLILLKWDRMIGRYIPTHSDVTRYAKPSKAIR